MDLILKTFGLVLIALFSSCQAQQTEKISIKNSKIIEANKQEFIGRPFSYLLGKIDQKSIKSILIPLTGKTEVGMITFNQISFNENRKTPIDNKPTYMRVIFYQNAEQLLGDRCLPSKEHPECAEWTKADEKRFGNLIVYDIYVGGKD